MNNKILAGVVALALVVITILGFNKNSGDKVGSVTQGGEYQSETIVPATSVTGRLLCTGAATLGTINLTGAAAGYIEVYDASTTDSTKRTLTATSSLRKLATIPVSAAIFSWPYDSVATNGLVWSVVGTAPTTTITYRCYN